MFENIQQPKSQSIMKNILLLTLTCAIVFACSKQDDAIDSELPGMVSMYFDMKKSNGKSFEEGDIFFNQGIYSNDNEWVIGEEWLTLQHGEFRDYFGPILFPLYWQDSGEEKGTELIRERYYLFKYPESETIDSLFVQGKKRVGEYQYYFDMFLNGEKIEYSEIEDITPSWLISITQKE